MSLLAKYNDIVKKGLTNTTIDDSYQLALIYNEMGLERARVRLERVELEQKVKDMESTRLLELRSQKIHGTDMKGNAKTTAKYTLDKVKAMVNQEVAQVKHDIALKEAMIERITTTMQSMQMLMPIIRDYHQGMYVKE